MTPSRTLALLLGVSLAACSGDSPTGPTVTSVAVSPGSSTLAPGGTVQLSARALDAQGQAVSGSTASWSSDDTGVAGVSVAGLVTAVGPGSATITATIAGVAGSATVSVTAPVVGCGNPTPVSLAVGGAVSFPASQCFTLPGGAAGDRYRVAVFRPDSGTASSVPNLTLTVAPATVAQAAVSLGWTAPPRTSRPPALPESMASVLRDGARMAEATERFHAELRRSEEGLVADARARGILPLRSRTEGFTASASLGAAAPASRLFDTSTPGQCTTAGGPKKTGLLVLESDELIIYQDSTQRASSPVSASQANQLSAHYRANGKRVIDSYFGGTSDVDENQKIIVFVSPMASGQTAGFVWTGDFFPASQCGESNEGEIIYLNNDIIQRLDPDHPEGQQFQAPGTLVHEAKHVASLYNRLQGNRGFHPLWVEEGTAEIAGEVASRIAWARTTGPAVGAPVTGQDIRDDGLTAENYATALRLFRTAFYLGSQPNSLILTPNGADDDHSPYGTGWTFHRWLGDAYGNAGVPLADSTLFRRLNEGSAPAGRAGIESVVGKTLGQLFEEFVLAVSLHSTDAPAGPHAFETYDFVSTIDVFNNTPTGRFPWPVTGTEDSPSKSLAAGTYTGPLAAYGIRIHDFVSTGSSALISADVSVPARIAVVRLR